MVTDADGSAAIASVILRLVIPDVMRPSFFRSHLKKVCLEAYRLPAYDTLYYACSRQIGVIAGEDRGSGCRIYYPHVPPDELTGLA